MKMRKAIKTIAALGAGATMLGATLTGAMAADLSNYPGMFIKDGQFNGLLVVGERADSIDTIGMTNIALGLQKAAVTKTTVCGTGTSTRTTVSGEQVLIKKTGDSLNLGDELADVQDVALDSGDLPSMLADGRYKESFGEEKNDVTYTQKLTLKSGTGDIVFDQDDDHAPDAGVYLKFVKRVDMYDFVLEFDTDVDYDADGEDDDFQGSTLEIQGQTYTIIGTDYDAGSDEITKFTMMVGDTLTWIMQGQTVTKEVDGVEHEITMLNVNTAADTCGFNIDGSIVWIEKDQTETIGSLTLGVVDALAVNSESKTDDMCKVFLGANELVLEDGQELELNGDYIENSNVAIESDGDSWSKLTFSYEATDDVYLAEGDEFVDPVFGNFKFIMGGEVANYEEIELDISGDDALLTFMNYANKEVQIPWAMDKNDGDFVLGSDPDVASNPEDGFYLQGDTCDGGGDVQECEGARFLAITSGDVAHVIELTSIDDPTRTNPKIKFDDLTYGTSSEQDLENGEADYSLGSGVGTITLDIDDAAGTIEFVNIVKGDLLTRYKGLLDINSTYKSDAGDFAYFFLTENDEEDNEVKLRFNMTQGEGSDSDTIEIQAPAKISGGTVYGAKDLSDTDDDNQVYMTEFGSRIVYDSDDKGSLVIWHPEEQLFVDVWVAETGATTTTVEGAGEGCTVVTTQNPIPSTVNKFDTEVGDNYRASNVISIGGPCANSVSSKLLGNPEVCYEGFVEGKSILQLFEFGDKVALLVAGATGADTRATSKVLQDYENYDLSGTKMTVTTASMVVEPFVETAVEDVEDEE